MKRWIHLIFTVMMAAELLVIMATMGHGQSEAEAGGDLLVQQIKDTTKSVRLLNGKPLKVWASDGNLYEGNLTKVTDTSFALGKIEIPFSRTVKVATVRGGGGKQAGISTLIVGTVGTLIGFILGIIGGLTLNNAPTCNQAFGGFLLLLLGIAVGIAGIVILIIGIVAYAIGTSVGRSFKFPGKWRLRKAG